MYNLHQALRKLLGHFNLISGAMHCAKKAKVESQSAESLDRLSSLPPELKVAILSKLNVVDAIRASILSSAWRNVATYSVRYVSHLRHITVQIYYTGRSVTVAPQWTSSFVFNLMFEELP